MVRKLASIQVVTEVKVLEDTETLDQIRVLGWNVVGKRGQYKPGDQVVYIEIDSLLPDKPEFEFLRKFKFRVKTAKLRGYISQGLCFPVTDIFSSEQLEALKVGDDVTELMEITKWEPAPPVFTLRSGKPVSAFPSFIKKTDETRLQSIPDVLDRHRDTLFYVAEKVDGTSSTYFIRDGLYGVCSRNQQLPADDDNVYSEMGRMLKLEEKLKTLGRNLALQGEIIGPKIQKNKYARKGFEFHLFSIWDIDTQQHVCFAELVSMAQKLGVVHVPILEPKFKLLSSVDEMVAFSQKDKSVLHPTLREGVVIRALDDSSLSFKVINPEFLLKHDE